MPGDGRPRVYVEEVHTDRRPGDVTAIRFTVHYGRTQAHISILPAAPRSDRAGIAEIARDEIRRLIDALVMAAEPGSSISGRPSR